MALRTLEDLYVEELKDLYNAEQQITKALPKMSKAAASPRLKDAFNQHLDQTREQIKRLDRIFDELGRSPRGKRCRGMEGLIEEGKEIMTADADPAVRDAGLISQAQRVEHYEMASYGTARTYAKLLGYDDAAQSLQQTLDEEGDTDHRLTDLAVRTINPQAEQEGDGRVDEDMETRIRGSAYIGNVETEEEL
jgi:ferritin-like metal-binding protein YciE